MTETQKKRIIQLPYELFEHIIIPDLLSEHLHGLVVDRERPSWHAFYVLPLVSRDFNATCRKLMPDVVGDKPSSKQKLKPISHVRDEEEDDELHGTNEEDDLATVHGDGDDFLTDDEDEDVCWDPGQQIDYARNICQKALRPSRNASHSHHHFAMKTLLSNPCLLRVYVCYAIGKLFFNTDILQPLGALTGTARGVAAGSTPWDEDYEVEYEVQFPRTEMVDSNFYRCFMPWHVAQQICDSIRPERLACIVGEYIGAVLPHYHSLQLFVKFDMDLRITVERKYYMELSDYIHWCSTTLTCLEKSEKTLKDMLSSGKLVTSFCTHGGRIPKETIKLSNIIEALDDVVKAEWDSSTNVIRARAKALILRWS